MLYTPVYDIGRSRAYCGPTAMAAVTGEPISIIRNALRRASGKILRANGSAYPVKGVSDDNLIDAM